MSPSRKDYLPVIPAQSPIVVPPSTPAGSGAGLWSSFKGAVGSPVVPTERPTSSVFDRVEQKPREMTIGGWGSVVPMVYGRVKLAPTVPVLKTFDGDPNLYSIFVWSVGRCEGVNALYLDGEASTEWAGFTTQHFYGTASQTYPAGLHAVYPAYEDNLANIANTFLKFGREYGGSDPVKTAAADFSGRWLYDPREAGHDEEDPETWAFSVNPILALADWLWRDDGEGRGFDSINWDSVGDAADWCDELVNGEPRHTIGLAIRELRPVREWREALRGYAHAILYQDGGKTVMVPGRPRAVDFYIATDDIKPGSLQLTAKRDQDLPNVVEVSFTDQDNNWADGLVRVAAGDETRVSRVSMPGIVKYNEAWREALERLNRTFLTPNGVRLDLLAIGEKIAPGDVIRIDDPTFPLVAAQYRVLRKRRQGLRLWGIDGEKYDENVYSDAVAPPPDYSNPAGADSFNPPAVTGLAVTEELAVTRDGRVYTRICAVWDDMGASYPYVDSYLVEMTAGELSYPRTPISGTEWTFGPAVDGVTYIVRVYLRSSTLNLSPAAEKSVDAKGKEIEPSRVPWFKATGLVGSVHLRWGEAVDIGPLKYEIRVGSPGDSWDDAEFVDRMAALSFFDPSVQAGTYRYFVKAVDEYENFSSGADQYADVTVEDGSFIRIAEFEWTPDLMVNTAKITYYHVLGEGWYAAPDNGEGIGYGHAGADDTHGFGDLADVPFLLPRSTHGGADGTNDTIVTQGQNAPGNLGSVVDALFSMSGMSVHLVENGDNAEVSEGIQLYEGSTWVDKDAYSVSGVSQIVRPYVRDKCDGPNAGFIVSMPTAARVVVMKQKTEDEGIAAMTPTNQPVSVAFTKNFSELAGSSFAINGSSSTPLSARWKDLTIDGGYLYLYDNAGNYATGSILWKVWGP